MAMRFAIVAAALLARLASAQTVQCDFETAPDFDDNCSTFSANWGLTVQELINLNPGITCPNLDTEKTWCVVGKVSSSTAAGPSKTSSTPTSTQPATTSAIKTTSSTPVTTQPATTNRPTTSSTLVTTTSAAANQPQNSGTASNCNNFYKVSSGDSCDVITSKFGISLAQFRTWNTAVNSGCTNLFLDYYYCVGVPGATTTPPPTKTTATTTSAGNGVSTPTPYQTGMTTNCNRFTKVMSGDTCDAITSRAGISFNQFRSWNTAVNADCTNLFLDYYYCVGVPGATTTPPATKTTTTAGNGIATPTPYQSNMTKSCKSFYEVVSGDYCDLIAQKFRITSSQIIKWNPDVGSQCKSLWVGYYICVNGP